MSLELVLHETRIEHEVFYPHPRERVWEALSESEVLAAWLMENDLEALEVGQTFEFHDDHVPLLWDGTVRCRVLTVEPPERLVISWNGGGKSPETEVSWRLEPEDDGTRLHFTHEGFDGLRGLMMKRGLQGGWHDMYTIALPEVLRRLEVGKPLPEPGELC